jgi:non-ribosomal peptide synthetase component F
MDYPRPQTRNYGGNLAVFVIEPGEAQKLRTLANQENATMYIVILTLFNILLSKLTLREDIIIGSLAVGRKHPDLENIMGMFINTLAFRNYPQKDKKFIDFLREVKKNTLEAFDNEDYQFDDLVDKLKAARETNRNPLFDVLFMFAPKPPETPTKDNTEDAALKITPYEEGDAQVKFDLLFTGSDTGENLFFTIQYSTELFKHETIERYIKYFKEIITTVAKNETLLLKDISISYELVTAVSDIYRHSETDFDL